MSKSNAQTVVSNTILQESKPSYPGEGQTWAGSMENEPGASCIAEKEVF